MDACAIEEILSCESLPSLPATAVRVLELSQDPDCTVNELAETIRFDQGLSAKILKTVNSSFFGLRTKCATIDKALVVLGMRELRNLALGFSLVPAMESAYTAGFDPIDYWRRGIYSAVAAKIIAQSVAREVADEAFLGGLMQDIGIMAMLQALGQPYEEVLAKAKIDHRRLAAAELHAFDMQHPEVGALLARKWQLPDELCVPIRFHERPTAAPNDLKDVVSCVALGNSVHQCLTYEDKAGCFERFYSQAKRSFNLEQSKCDEIIKQTAAAAKEVSRLFELDTGASVDADALLKKAAELQSEPATKQDQLSQGSVSAVIRDGDLIDPITGVKTRLAIERHLDAAYDAGKDARTPVSLAMIRLDGFAELIQKEGLEAGDIAAIDLTESLQDVCEGLENADLGAFDDATVILMCTSPLPVLTVAMSAWHDSYRGKPNQTTSVGLTSCQGDAYDVFTKPKQLLAVAYRAMEAAERAGGNGLRTFEPGKDKRAA
jgi:HD-like signal output (HDOD) protein/GGDEF domain-containing protein